jgi:hypothetical protein
MALVFQSLPRSAKEWQTVLDLKSVVDNMIIEKEKRCFTQLLYINIEQTENSAYIALVNTMIS